MTIKKSLLSVFISSVVMLMGCKEPVTRLTISGSTTLFPLISKAAHNYQAKTGLVVDVNAGGSGGGFNQLAQGLTHIGMMSRDITEDEREQFKTFTFESIVIGRDAVVPVVSSEVYKAGVTGVSFQNIADIYAGKIDNWSELGGPDKEIFVIDKARSSGTRQTFFKIVTGDNDYSAAGTDLVISSNDEEQAAIMQSDSAIGLLSLAWLNEDVNGLAVKIASGDFITPSLESIRNGNYPITRDLNVVIRNDAPPLANEFVSYLLSDEGQEFVARSGYVPVKN